MSINIKDKVLKFFKKKKLDSKFKNAGEGQRLNDSCRQPIIIKEEFDVMPRQELSESAQKAAEAALIREYEKNVIKPKPKVNDNIMRKEIESEKNELEKAYDFRDRARGKVVEMEKSKILSELLFCCPILFDYEVIGNYNEIKEKIFKYIESEAEENPLESSCLVIHSKCSNPEILKSCVNILETLINNLLKSPHELKFRKIRLSNEKIRQNIVEVEGAVEFLKAIGFKSEQQLKPDTVDEYESFMVISEDDIKPERLAECLEKLQAAEPLKPVLYRNTKVYHKSNLVNLTEGDLPAEFFRISLEEIKRQNELRRQQVEESGMLLTKQMRENLKMRERRRYRYVLIRVMFPNNWVLQGTFAAFDKISDIRDWLSDCLSTTEPFILSVPPITKRIDDLDQTIVDANLAPCSILRLSFENGALNQCIDKDANNFLKTELLV